METLTFQLHDGDPTTYPLAPRTLKAQRQAVAMRCARATADLETCKEVAKTWGMKVTYEGGRRVLEMKDGTRKTLPHLTDRDFAAAVAPIILEGVTEGDVNPRRLKVPEVARAYLYWSTNPNRRSQLDAVFGAEMLARMDLNQDT